METEVAQSAVLNESEVADALAETAEDTQEVSLPSDEPKFEIPEKFKGKSVEDIIKSYLELEKFKGKQTEAPKEDVQEDVQNDVEDEAEALYNKYATSLDTNGSLSEAEYAELAEMGYSKEVVDAEIESRNEQKEFQQYKREKALNDILAPLGGGTEKFKEVADWANTTKTPEEVAEFNKALAAAPKLAQQAMLKTLYAEYDSSTSNTVLHTNTPQATTSRGYATESEFFADMSNPAYKTDKSYVKAVEAKLARSNTKDWSF